MFRGFNVSENRFKILNLSFIAAQRQKSEKSHNSNSFKISFYKYGRKKNVLSIINTEKVI